jgi:hypothetical protein
LVSNSFKLICLGLNSSKPSALQLAPSVTHSHFSLSHPAARPHSPEPAHMPATPPTPPLPPFPSSTLSAASRAHRCWVGRGGRPTTRHLCPDPLSPSSTRCHYSQPPGSLSPLGPKMSRRCAPSFFFFHVDRWPLKQAIISLSTPLPSRPPHTLGAPPLT